MSSAKDFDSSATLHALDAAYKLFPEDSAEAKAIRLAVSLMIFTAGKRPVLKEFLKWLEVAALPASQVPFNALHEFATQEEADAWRARGTPVRRPQKGPHPSYTFVVVGGVAVFSAGLR